jgi:small-conductance mechanosensitive channel
MKSTLDYNLFSLGKVNFTITSLISLIIFWVGLITLFYLIKRLIYKLDKIEYNKKYSIVSLLKYFIYFLGVVISLQIIGFDTTIFVAGSTALLVGLGLGIQNLFSDYISGIIILFDSSIKVEDVLDVEGLVCQVKEINLRTTKVVTRDDKYILLPNTDLTRKQVINWTHQKVDSRFEVSVGVDYSSDPDLVKNIMINCAKKNPNINQEPQPFVRFNNFGESSLDFTIYFWTSHVFRVENIQSELRNDILREFRANNIHIPFPQRVLHQAK